MENQALPIQTRQAWETFCRLAEQARKEGYSIYLSNSKHFDKFDHYYNAQLIHTTEDTLELSVTKTIKY